MATNTLHLNLRKPGASDNIDYAADLDDNWDILDNAALITETISATATGTVQGPGIALGAASFIDNDFHSWESDGAGGWVFRNRVNTGNGSMRFYCDVGGLERLRISAISGGGSDTGLFLQHQGVGAASFDRVTLGAVDSGGAGFRLLRLPN